MLKTPKITQLTKNHIKERMLGMAVESIGLKVEADILLLDIVEHKLDIWVQEVENELRKGYVNEK